MRHLGGVPASAQRFLTDLCPSHLAAPLDPAREARRRREEALATISDCTDPWAEAPRERLTGAPIGDG